MLAVIQVRSLRWHDRDLFQLPDPRLGFRPGEANVGSVSTVEIWLPGMVWHLRCLSCQTGEVSKQGIAVALFE